MTTSRRQTVFASLDPRRPGPRRAGARSRNGSSSSSTRCPGVGVTLKRKLAKLGLATVRDLLEHRPHRYESAVDEIAIAKLGGSEEVVIVGEVLNVSKRPLRGRRTLVTARVSDGTATVTAGWFNQPWVADQLAARDARAAARQDRPVRLRRQVVRRRRGRGDGGLRARLSGERGDHAEAAADARHARARARRRLLRSAAGRAARARGAAAEARRALRDPPPASRARGGDGPAAARVRGAAAAPARDRAPRGRARAHARAVARRRPAS